jgi:class 3 adenylate cyclase
VLCISCHRDNPPDASFCNGCGGRLAEPAVAVVVPPVQPLPSSFADGRYGVERFLGEGGRKRVYLAHDTKLDRSVAVAVVKAEGLDADALARVRREAQAMARLGDHPNIVTVFDIGDEEAADGQAHPYIVSQYMDGGDLANMLQQAEGSRLPLDDTLRIASQVCAGLDHAHGKGIIHRDLKPGNVWLSVDGTAKLGDFGLAVALDRSRLTMEGMMVGTVAYMAPEQALGRRPDARSDLYSLGCMLYEMATGRPPFVGDDAVSLIGQHINTAPIVPSWHNPETPRDLEALILQLLEKDPEKRPASAVAVTEAMSTITPATHTGLSSAGPSPAAGAEAPTYRRTFIGREAELRHLQASFEAASSGQGALMMVVGEPGIGKTSVCEQLSTYAAVRGGRTLVGHCYEEGSLSLAYLPFIEAMRSYVLTREGDDLRKELGSGAADVARIVSEVRDRVDIEATPPASPEEERYRLFQAVTTFLRNASNAQPLVIVLEDLHDADRGTLDLLLHLARYLAGSRLLLIGTYRDVEVDRTHALSGALVELRRHAQYDRIALRGLTADEVQRMLASIAGQDIQWGLAEAVFRQTEGNPLFVQEVTRYLAEEGLVKGSHGSWQSTTEQLALSIPEGLRDVVGKRLSRLSESCNRLLAIASVIGREFSLATLQAVASLDEEALLGALEEAVHVGVLEERSRAGDVRYRFAHAFFRQSLYEEMIAPRRIRMHQQVAQALEQQYAERLEEHAAELAEHFSYSSDKSQLGKAVAYGVMAAQRASAVFAHGEAAALYGRALDVQEVLDPSDRARRYDLLLAQAPAYRHAGDIDAARLALFEAADIAREIEDNDRLFAAADAGSRFVWMIGVADQAMERLIDDGLEKGGEAPSVTRVRLLCNRALRMMSVYDDLDAGRKVAEEAVATAREIGDASALILALQAYSYTLLHPRRFEERTRIVDEIGRLAEKQGDIEVRERLLVTRGIGALQGGSLREATRHIDEHAEFVDRYRLGLGVSTQRGWRVEFARLSGRFEEAERLLDQQGQSDVLRWQERDEFRGAEFVRARVLADVGRLDEIIVAFEELLGRYGAVTFRQAFCVYIYAGSGRLDACRTWIQRLTEAGIDRLSGSSQWPVIAACLTEGCAALGDVALAEDIYPLLSPWSGFTLSFRTLTPTVAGPADRYLGVLATLMERWEDAERHLQSAIEFAKKMPSPPIVAQCQLDYARMLLQRGAAADVPRAIALLGEAVDAAGRMGMKPVLEKALALKLEAQGVDSTDVLTSIDFVASAAQRERTDLSPHAAPDGKITIMFTDIQASTQINHRLGDQRWMKVLRPHNKIIREQVKKHSGHEVKGGGDGFMIVFQDAVTGVRCALGIQETIAAHDWADADGEEIRVRIGLHTGEAVREAGDFYGRDVNMAARVADQARGGEIVVSADVKALAEAAGGFVFAEAREAALKGLPGPHEIWPLAPLSS